MENDVIHWRLSLVPLCLCVVSAQSIIISRSRNAAKPIVRVCTWFDHRFSTFSFIRLGVRRPTDARQMMSAVIYAVSSMNKFGLVIGGENVVIVTKQWSFIWLSCGVAWRDNISVLFISWILCGAAAHWHEFAFDRSSTNLISLLIFVDTQVCRFHHGTALPVPNDSMFC